jgi:hypothetical protein
MDPMEKKETKLARVVRELGAAIHEQANGRWSSVRMAKRDLGNSHVWRFRTGGGEPDRFLVVPHRGMTGGESPAAVLLTQLEKARWLDRMQEGPETRFRLTSSGRLRARPAE